MVLAKKGCERGARLPRGSAWPSRLDEGTGLGSLSAPRAANPTTRGTHPAGEKRAEPAGSEAGFSPSWAELWMRRGFGTWVPAESLDPRSWAGSEAFREGLELGCPRARRVAGTPGGGVSGGLGFAGVPEEPAWSVLARREAPWRRS